MAPANDLALLRRKGAGRGGGRGAGRSSYEPPPRAPRSPAGSEAWRSGVWKTKAATAEGSDPVKRGSSERTAAVASASTPSASAQVATQRGPTSG